MILTRNETARFLLERDHFVILTHIRPDGDTIGSAAALCRGLRQMGKTAHVLENKGVSDRFQWLHQGLTVEQPGENDTILTVDVASPGMLPDEFKHLLDRVLLRIDHHSSATSFTPYELVDGKSASCAEVIADVLSCMGVTLDKNIAEAIYVGTSTDTGCFRYANTTAHTFETAAACAASGAEIYRLNQELFETNTLGRLRMQSWIIDNMQLLRNNTLAVVAIPKAVETQMGVTGDDMDNISSFPRTVSGVQMAATIREGEKGVVKLSVRAVPGLDASAVCARFGGGGHVGAAGATLYLELGAAAAAVAEAMVEVCG